MCVVSVRISVPGYMNWFWIIVPLYTLTSRVDRAMAELYQEPNWSQEDIGSVISAKKERMTKSIWSVFSREKLKYYSEEIAKKEQDGYTTSAVDKMGLILEELVFGKVSSWTLYHIIRCITLKTRKGVSQPILLRFQRHRWRLNWQENIGQNSDVTHARLNVIWMIGII